MQFFDDQSFRDFLGQPIYESNHKWGIEKRFKVSRGKISEFIPQIRDTLYRHHSSFSIVDELGVLGFPLAEEALRRRNSGLPNDLRTRMGNIGEVIGAEFSRAYLGYATTVIFPKRLNPNLEQSMKGIDILGFREQNSPAEILLGEVKSYTTLDKRAVSEAYTNVITLAQHRALPIFFHFAREYLALQDDTSQIRNIDRHMAGNTPKNCLLFSVTQTKPREPFSNIPQNTDIQLLAVHVQLEGIRSFLPQFFT